MMRLLLPFLHLSDGPSAHTPPSARPNRHRRALLALLCGATALTTLTRPAYAIFGAGDIVYDPTNYLLQARQWLQQLKDNIESIRGILDIRGFIQTVVETVDETLAAPSEIVNLFLDIGGDIKDIYGDVIDIKDDISDLVSGRFDPLKYAEFYAKNYTLMGATFRRADAMFTRSSTRSKQMEKLLRANKRAKGQVEATQITNSALSTIANSINDMLQMQAQGQILSTQIEAQRQSVFDAANLSSHQKVDWGGIDKSTNFTGWQK